MLKQAKWFYLILSLVLGGSLAVRAAESVRPLPNAHAHNDYLHPRPLLDALAQGFCSVEADIYLVEGRLLVAHEAKEIRPDRTLEALYLDPLQQRAREHGGRIYPGGPPLVLLVDIKGDADATYAVLRETLARYSKLFTRFEQGKTIPGAVTVILSGNRPRKVLEQEPLRYAAMDGRLEDLGTGVDPALIPLVSTNWQLSFTWRGVDAFPAAEREKLRDYVRKAHEQHYRLRFWATPDTPAAWRELRDAGVDLINTDDLAGLAAFFRDGKS